MRENVKKYLELTESYRATLTSDQETFRLSLLRAWVKSFRGSRATWRVYFPTMRASIRAMASAYSTTQGETK